MRLSEILPQMDGKLEFKITNENEFEVLTLTASNINCASCVFVDNEKYIDDINDDVTMVLTTAEIGEDAVGENRGICTVENPRIVFFRLHNFLADKKGYRRAQFKTKIEDGAIVSNLASIAENNVIIRKGAIVEEFVVIRENVTIDEDSIIKAGTVLGGGGFEHKRDGNDVFSVKHVGGIVIGKNVDIAHNCCIENGIYPWADTIIGDNSRIDNLVLVAHACNIGRGVFVAGPVGFGGRVTVGDNTWIGYGAMIRNGITIGKNARVNMGAVVTKDVQDEQAVSGNFAIDHDKFIAKIKKRGLV